MRKRLIEERIESTIERTGRRYLEWLDVVAEEQRKLSVLSKLWLFTKLFYHGARVLFWPVTKARWFRRLRRCYRCPIFDRTMKRCRPYTGSDLGCGCYMPFAAMTKKHGWAFENVDNEELKKGCW